MTDSKIIQRKVTIISAMGKRYSGFIDVPNAALRTTDLFNSSSMFWKNQQDKCFDDGILLHNVKILFAKNAVYRELDNIQLRLSGVVAFLDEFTSIGSENERTRFESIKKKTGSQVQDITIYTTIIGNSFYEINGVFDGNLRKATTSRFLSLTQVNLAEIVYKDSKWFKNTISLPSGFLGINTSFIESLANSTAE